MSRVPSRRTFLGQSATAVAAACAPRALAAVPAPSFSFILLGDLHFDALAHHDMAWVEKEKPNDVAQIKNYSRITAEVTPRLLATVRATIADLNRDPATRVAFVLQAGDLVEGLCGREELAVKQNTEALAALRDAQLGAPLLFTKGNHDVTGPGSVAAFARVFHPFLSEQARRVMAGAADVTSGCYAVDCGDAQFVFLDAYEATKSLAWFEAMAAKRTAAHCFVAVHPPVVPYGARSTWHIFSSERDRARREKFLTLLGDQRAIVLGGHIHRFCALARTAGHGRFAQLAVSSILSAPAVQAKTPLAGVARYNADQISVEPNFSPANAAERRAVYDAERAFVTAFDYADLPGYAVVTVAGAQVTARMFAGATREPWRTVDLTALARG